MSATERIVGRPWTKHEDNLLKQAVAIHGENDNWKTVALSVPGRTNKACRKRWLHSLSPTVKKSAWTPDEDRLLLELYAIHSTKWSIIARYIPGRTDDACSKRYREALDPSLRKDEWTQNEDDQLLMIYARLGGKWGQVGQELRRSGLGCRNRWRLLERKRLASAASNQISAAVVNQTPSLSENTPQNAWSPMSMLDVTHYWTGEDSRPHYDANSTTLLSGHLPSYVRTQDITSDSLPHPAGPSGVSGEMHDLSAFTPPFYGSYSLNTALSLMRGSRMPPVDIPHSSLAPGSFTHSHGTQDQTVASTSLNSHSSPFHIEDAQIPSMDDGVEEDTDHMTTPSESDLPENVDVIDSLTTLDSSAPHSHGLRPSIDPRLTPSRDSVWQTRSFDEITSDRRPPSSPSTASSVPRSHSPSSSPLGCPPHYRPASKDHPRSSVSKRCKDRQIPLRLNADLSVTNDPEIRPYACGHRQCWPTDATIMTNLACFATSRELGDHSKNDHADDVLGGGKPFRCGLEGCGKSWKSINGLQYHLQISKAHFQRALSSVPHLASIGSTQAPSETNAQPVAQPKTKKIHTCPRPGCSNQYKQLSGLRYHLAHGHPDAGDIPVQLDVVPPTLARKVAERLLRCPPAST